MGDLRPLAGEKLAEDEGKNASVKVVFDFDGGIESAKNWGCFGGAVFPLNS